MFRKLIFLAILFLVSANAIAQSVDTAWVRRYNGPGNGADWASAIAVDASGSVYVTGRSIGSGTSEDYAAIKYYSNGDTAWVRSYNGPGNGVDEAHAITLDGSGNVYVTGKSIGSGTSEDYATIKYYSNGDTAWVRRYNGPGNDFDQAYAIAVDDSGNVYVTGGSRSGTTQDYATIKYSPNGDTAWVRRYNGPGNAADWTSAITLDDSGSAYVTGQSWNGLDYDYASIKYYSNGDTAWVRRYNGWGNGYDYAYAIAVDGSGSAYVTGRSDGSGTSYDYATIKYSPNEDTAWVRRYNGPGNSSDNANALAIDGSGNVYVTGQSFSNSSNYDYATIKYYSNGDTAWVRSYNGPGNGSDGALAISVDGSGSVYVTGQNTGSGTNLDYATIKYYSNGDITWVRRYNGPGNGADFADDIAVDGLGNVYVTGTSLGSGTGYDYATIKYSLCKTRTDTLTISAYSPVDLIVTAPNVDSIGVNFNTIPGATYDTTQDRNHDGDKDDIVKIPSPIIGQYMVRVVAEPGGSGNYTLAIKLNGNEDRVMIANAPAPGPGEVDTVTYTVPEYLHGDANRDEKKTVSDVVFLINYLFKGGPAPVPVDLGDVNFCNQNPPVPPGQPTVADVVYLVNYLFKGGPAPCS